MTIEELYNLKEISTRSYNICMQNNLNSTKDLKEYHAKHETFSDLLKCGRRSNEELIELCFKYNVDYLNNIEDEPEKENHLKTLVSNLTQIQKNVINSLIVSETNNLSVRSKNAILHYLENDFSIENFAERIFLQDTFNVLKIKKVGKKSAPEMKVYLSIIKDIMLEVSETDNQEDLTILKNKLFIQHTFSISDVPQEISDSQSIFLLINFLLNQHALFDEKQTVVVKNAFRIYQNQKELTLNEIAELINLTTEGVRQIRNKSYENLFNQLSFIKNFKQDLHQNYNIDVNSNHINIDDAIVETINTKNRTNFSKEFITYLLSVHLHDKFVLIGNLEKVLLMNKVNYKSYHEWKNIYLIKNEIVEKFNFTALFNDISVRINGKIDESYSLNFKKHLLSFLVNNERDLIDEIAAIAEIIINNEFGLYLDENNELVFKRNTLKQAHEYPYEALKLIGKASKLDNICSEISKRHHYYDTDREKVRAAMQNDLFVAVGKESVYGLKEWEQHHVNFKGGTIRRIVEEYLEQYNIPINISKIAEHVLKYRPKSNEYSILQNLKLEETGRFVFFEESLVGLSTKSYPNTYIDLSESNRYVRTSWEDSFKNLQQFIENNKRLPFASGESEAEQTLYRWLKVQKNKLSKNRLETDKAKLINGIINNGSDLSSKFKLNAIKRYDNLIEFVNTNFRLPSASKEEELHLYSFYYKRRKRFEENKLEGIEKEKYEEVLRMLDAVK